MLLSNYIFIIQFEFYIDNQTIFYHILWKNLYQKHILLEKVYILKKNNDIYMVITGIIVVMNN